MTATTTLRRTNRAPKSAVVVNPAKIQDVAALRATVDGALSRAGWPAPQWFETTPDDPGRGQARAAIESGAEVVFVCGGDGTVMSAVSALAGTDASLAILPAGTGNLLAANLGFDDPAAADRRIVDRFGCNRPRRAQRRRKRPCERSPRHSHCPAPCHHRPLKSPNPCFRGALYSFT